MSRFFIAASMAFVFVVTTGPLSLDADTQQPVYADHFTEAALRVDLIHTGARGKEFFGIEELVVEPIWPGTRAHLIDPTGYGKYRFLIIDSKSKKPIFTQGYCTLFGEWTTTGEAAEGGYKSMNEPLRFPMPKAPFELVIEVRKHETGAFTEIQRFSIDPLAYDLRREQKYDFEVVSLHDSGKKPSQAVDMVIIPDGYSTGDELKMMADAKRFAGALLEQSPFDKHKDEINFRLVKAFSRESGTDEPRKGVFRDTIVDTTFDTFHSPRYLTTSNMKAVREVASLAPYDTIFVMVNTNRYGGGGIPGWYSIFSSDTEYDEYVMIHEFGHGFGGLADEYFDGSTGYDDDEFYAAGVEPWEPNITIATNAENIKWKKQLTPGVPIPTPNTDEYKDAVGLFEGGGYKAKGIYRPTLDSKMFHKGLLPFGPVNEAAIETMISYYTNAEVTR